MIKRQPINQTVRFVEQLYDHRDCDYEHLSETQPAQSVLERFSEELVPSLFAVCVENSAHLQLILEATFAAIRQRAGVET